MRIIKYLVVHCTATPLTATIASIRSHWEKVLKWKNPGYHYIIKPDGEVVSINSEENISNGVAGHNRYSIHVSYIGGVDDKGKPADNRTDQQKEALYNLLLKLADKYPDATTLGHRDLSPDINKNGVIEPFEWIKGCPCFDVAEWLAEYPQTRKAA